MSSKRGYVPERGDVVNLNFSPQAGHEQAGKRPALVISEKKFNQKGLFFVAPITNQVKGHAWEIPVPKGYGVTGVILANQLKFLDWKARKADFLINMGDGVVEDVVEVFLPIVDPDNVFTTPPDTDG